MQKIVEIVKCMQKKEYVQVYDGEQTRVIIPYSLLSLDDSGHNWRVRGVTSTGLGMSFTLYI